MRNILGSALLALLVAGCGEKGRDAVIPDSIAVTAPGADVPAGFAAFSGVWSGRWGECLPGKLAVLTVSADGAVQTYYAWGDCRPLGRRQAGTLYGGLIDGNVLRLEEFADGAKVTYTLTEEGVLEGAYFLNGETTTGVFRREDGE